MDSSTITSGEQSTYASARQYDNVVGGLQEVDSIVHGIILMELDPLRQLARDAEVEKRTEGIIRGTLEERREANVERGT